MNIVEINTVCGIGSTGRIVAQISEILNDSGDSCVVAYGREKSDTSDAVKIGNKIGTLVHVVASRIFDAQGRFSQFSTYRFINFLKSFKPDVVHLHNIHGYYLNYSMIFDYFRKENIPVIWTLHDCWPFTGHCAYYDYIRCEKWKLECNKCQLKKSYPSSFVFDRSKANYNKKKNCYSTGLDLTIVTPSYWLATQVKESFLKEYPIEVIHNGIDLSKFYPRDARNIRKKYRLGPQKVLLGVASGFDERKGLSDYVKLSSIIPSDSQIVLVGCEPITIPDGARLTCIKETDSIDELAEFYSLADVLINLTYEDNFPTVNLESLACGTPIITYNTGGSPEAIDDKCGIVVEKGDLDGVVDAITTVLSNPFSEADCISRSKKFDKNVNFQKYVNLIHSKNKESRA